MIGAGPSDSCVNMPRLSKRATTLLLFGGVFACAYAAIELRSEVGALLSAAWHGQRTTKVTLGAANEVITVAPEGITVKRISPQDMTQQLSWASAVQGDVWLVFQGESLREAVATFNRYNRRQLSVADERTGQLQVGGKFRPTDLQGFLAALQVTHGVAALPQQGDGAPGEVIVLKQDVAGTAQGGPPTPGNNK